MAEDPGEPGVGDGAESRVEGSLSMRPRWAHHWKYEREGGGRAGDGGLGVPAGGQKAR